MRAYQQTWFLDTDNHNKQYLINSCPPLGPLRPIVPGGPLRPGSPLAPACPGKPLSPEGPGGPGGPGLPGSPIAPDSGLLRLAASWASCSITRNTYFKICMNNSADIAFFSKYTCKTMK